jgi:hypothetical protein
MGVSFYIAGQEGGSWSSALLMASPAVTALIISISSSSSSFTAFNRLLYAIVEKLITNLAV